MTCLKVIFINQNHIMQSKLVFSSILFLQFFVFSTLVNAQSNRGKDISILYSVNAEVIFNGGDVEENSKLSDNNQGKSPDGKASEFESEAYISKFVNWEIVDAGSNGDYQVKFLDFPWVGDIDAFSKNPIQGGGKKAKAKINDNSAEGDLKYTIRFTIRNKRTRETKTFELDPRLRVRRVTT